MNKNGYVCAFSASDTKIAPVRSALAEEPERLLAAASAEAGELIYIFPRIMTRMSVKSQPYE